MPDLGNKHECEKCGTKFYDLGGSKIVCPKCNWNPDEPDAPPEPPAEDEPDKGE